MQTHKWDTSAEPKNRWLTSLLWSLEKWMETVLCVRGGRMTFFDIIKPVGGVWGVFCQEELLFTLTCRHGTFEAFVKRGIWHRATRVLSFTNSSLLWDDNARSRLQLPLRGKRFQNPIKWGSCSRSLMHKGDDEWCLFSSVIKVALTWCQTVTDKPCFSLFINVGSPHSFLSVWWKTVSHSNFVLSLTVCGGGPGKRSYLMLSWLKLFSYHFLETLILASVSCCSFRCLTVVFVRCCPLTIVRQTRKRFLFEI